MNRVFSEEDLQRAILSYDMKEIDRSLAVTQSELLAAATELCDGVVLRLGRESHGTARVRDAIREYKVARRIP